MAAVLRTLFFGLIAYALGAWLTLEVGPGASGRFGHSDTVLKALFVNGPIAGLVGLVFGFLLPCPRRRPPAD